MSCKKPWCTLFFTVTPALVATTFYLAQSSKDRCTDYFSQLITAFLDGNMDLSKIIFLINKIIKIPLPQPILPGIENPFNYPAQQFPNSTLTLDFSFSGALGGNFTFRSLLSNTLVQFLESVPSLTGVICESLIGMVGVLLFLIVTGFYSNLLYTYYKNPASSVATPTPQPLPSLRVPSPEIQLEIKPAHKTP